MTRRTAWLMVLIAATQFAAGCCHHRCGWWRFRHCGTCAAAFDGAAASAPCASCPSCFYGPSAGSPVLMGPPATFAPGAAVPPAVGPTVVEPSREAPQAMPMKPPQ